MTTVFVPNLSECVDRAHLEGMQLRIGMATAPEERARAVAAVHGYLSDSLEAHSSALNEPAGACPAWCEDSPHGWSVDLDNRLHRVHNCGNMTANGAVLCQYEYLDDDDPEAAVVEVDERCLGEDGRMSSAQARVLAAELVRLADFLDGASNV